LKSLHVEYRKVAGHKGDEWNNVVDRLAVKGRDEAGGLPRCTFVVHLPSGEIPFREGPIPGHLKPEFIFTMLQGETTIILAAMEECLIMRDGKAQVRRWTTGRYDIRLKTAPGIPREALEGAPELPGVKVSLARMHAGREPGKGSGQAAPKMVEIVFTVWHENRERNGMVRIPDRITHEDLVKEVGRELELDLGRPMRWWLWMGDRPAAPPLVEGNEYGLVPADISSSISTESIAKRNIEFTSQIRRHGPMSTVIVSVLGTRQTMKVPPEVTLSQLIRRNMTVGTLPPETVFSWGSVTSGAPGRLQEGGIVEIKVGGNEVS
jgi:hypothetical protein